MSSSPFREKYLIGVFVNDVCVSSFERELKKTKQLSSYKRYFSREFKKRLDQDDVEVVIVEI